MSRAIRLPGTLNGAGPRKKAALATKADPPVIPAGAPMIGRLASFAHPAAVHAMTMRCRECRLLVTDEGGSSETVHAAVRQHWATKHADALAAMTAAPVMAAAPAPAPAQRARPAPRPITPPATPGTCKNRKYRSDHGVVVHPPKTAIDPQPCEAPGCTEVVVQNPRGAVRLHCSPKCTDRVRAARRREGRESYPIVTCMADGCTETFDQGPYGRRFCSGQCKQRTAKARALELVSA